MRVFELSKVMVVVAGVGLAACGEGTDSALDALGGTGGAGGTLGDGSVAGTGGSTGGTDTGTPAPGAYRWLAIVDTVGVAVCTTTGPGADIDSVTLKRGTTTVGVGLSGSAMYKDIFPGTSAVPCTACGTGATCANSGDAAAERVTGVRDARSYASMPDTGYASLNGGAIWLQIGSSSGGGSAQDILKGDTLTVNEVDQTYLKDMSAFAGCSCQPEPYAVYAYVTMGDASTRVQLTPTAYRSDNTGVCPATPDMNGCGTTDFVVP
jgi:hypothetical protein